MHLETGSLAPYVSLIYSSPEKHILPQDTLERVSTSKQIVELALKPASRAKNNCSLSEELVGYYCEPAQLCFFFSQTDMFHCLIMGAGTEPRDNKAVESKHLLCCPDL